MQPNKLAETFNELQKVFPDLTAGKAPLGGGMWGIVLDNKDGTVTKILTGSGRKKSPTTLSY